ncbi:MAG: S41 family peptidase [Planctomycetes bacterium]|nr:S41 family peptidase [Planctomycetota bacterium]
MKKLIVESCLLLCFTSAWLTAIDQDDTLSNVENYSENYWNYVYDLEATYNGKQKILKEAANQSTPFKKLAISYVLAKKEGDINYFDTILSLCSNKDDLVQEQSCNALSLLLRHTKKNKEIQTICFGYLDNLIDSEKSESRKLRVAKTRNEVSLSIKASDTISNLFENSKSKLVRDDAALALAEMGSFDNVKGYLYQLAREPTVYGKLAQKIIDLKKTKSTEGHNRYNFEPLEKLIEKLITFYYKPSDINIDDLIVKAMKTVAAELDPYTVFFTKDELKGFKDAIHGKYGGIGAFVSLRKDKAGNSWLTIDEPISGSPCFKAGIKNGDKIIEINGQITVNMELEELISKLKGDPGTEVKVKVVSPRWEKPKEITLIRSVINITLCNSTKLPGDIGYIQLRTFSVGCDKLVRNELENLGPVKGLIFDLRGNTGGDLMATIGIAGIFLPDDKVVIEQRSENEKTKNSISETLKTRSNNKNELKNKCLDIPLVILIDGASASASEVLSGALKDHKRAVLIGEKTFGKGSVQHILELDNYDNEDKGALKVTIARWFTPSGQTIHGTGITPDIVIPRNEPDLLKSLLIDKVVSSGAFAKYTEKYFDKNKMLFIKLAESDEKKPLLYPGFAEFYVSLKTQLSQDDIREVLRFNIRQRVQDDTEKRFICDYEEDIQLQSAIKELMKHCKVDIKNIPQYSVMSD